MSKHDVEYKGKWACYSSFNDGFMSQFLSREEYDKWKIHDCGSIREYEAMDMNVTIDFLTYFHSRKEIERMLKWAGLAEPDVYILLAGRTFNKVGKKTIG